MRRRKRRPRYPRALLRRNRQLHRTISRLRRLRKTRLNPHPRLSPGHRIPRLHLRLHPGRGFATVIGLWLRWGRLAALRRSGRIRRSLPLWLRALAPGEHSVFLGRAHYRHRLRVPLEEHVLVMAPPRTGKTAFLADVILRYRGPVISTTTKADVFALTAGVRSLRGPVHVFNPQLIGGVASTFAWSPLATDLLRICYGCTR